jgi:hypothetical protein
MANAVRIREIVAPEGDLSTFDPGRYLSGLEFYESDTPVTDADRDGLAQFVHYLGFVALRAQSSSFGSSVIRGTSTAYRALESHFGDLPEWPQGSSPPADLSYRQLAWFLMRHYPPHPLGEGASAEGAS